MVSPILWQSKKIPRVTKSSLASETLGVGEAVDAGIFIVNLMMEVYRLDNSPAVTCYTEGKSLKIHLHSTNTISDSNLRVNMARFHQMVDLKEVTVVWIPGQCNVADVLTKRTASSEALLQVLRSGVLYNGGN